jgi:hypothetical protein
MQVSLTMTPEKTAGSGFGSPGSPEDGDRVQKSDIYIKYDPRTKTGYSLRYWRTTQSTEKCMFQLYRIDGGVGTPLNDTQVLTGVFKPNTELTMRVTGDRLTVEARNTEDAETLTLEGTIVPSEFGGAGVAWYGTVPRGNSNVYSKIEISYAGTESTCAPLLPEPGANADPGAPPELVGKPALSARSTSDGCALGASARTIGLSCAALLAVAAALARRSRARRTTTHR